MGFVSAQRQNVFRVAALESAACLLLVGIVALTGHVPAPGTWAEWAATSLLLIHILALIGVVAGAAWRGSRSAASTLPHDWQCRSERRNQASCVASSCDRR